MAALYILDYSATVEPTPTAVAGTTDATPTVSGPTGATAAHSFRSPSPAVGCVLMMMIAACTVFINRLLDAY